MAETEKITINMNVVDLGKIDLLVARGFYSSRTDFIRAAIRDLAARYEEDLRRDVIFKSAGLGAFNITRKELEEIRATGAQKEFTVIGLISIDSDVTPIGPGDHPPTACLWCAARQ